MAIPASRSYTISANNLVSNALSHTQQFQEEVYQFKALQVAAGGVIEASNGGGTATTRQTQLFVTPASPNSSTLYRVIINGTNVDYTTDGSATQAELRDNLIIAINNTVGGAVVASASTNDVLVTGNSETAFTYSIAAGPAAPLTLGASVALANVDNIPNAAAVTLGAAGVGAWWIVRFANLGGGVVRLMFNVNDASDPRQVVDYRGGNATWTGGSTSALPTVATGFAFATVSMTAFMPYTTTRNAYWSSWRSTNVSGAQSIRFLFKEAAATLESGILFFCIEGNTSLDGGGTNLGERWGAGHVTALTNAAFNGSWLNGVTPAGTAAETKQAHAAIWSIAALWTAGLNAAGHESPQPLLLGATAASGRNFGSFVDVFAIPQLSTTGTYADSTESAQNPRRMNFGDIAMYWPIATVIS